MVQSLFKRPAFMAAVGGAVAVPSAAQAEPNYRVCGVYNSAQSTGAIGTGLVVKVWKGDDTNTCGKKIDAMRKMYPRAWRGSTAKLDYRMMRCEDFAIKTGFQSDPCDLLRVNTIYRVYSTWDLYHPVTDANILVV